MNMLAPALVRVFVLLAVALAAMPLLVRAPAAARRRVLALAFGLALVAPFASLVAPAAIVPPEVVSAARAPFAEPLEAVEVASAAASPRPVAAPSSFPWSTALSAAWLVGATALAVRVVVARVRAARLGRGGVALEPRVLVTSDVDGPVVTGTFAPRILLPPAALEWSEERLAVVLAHERAHVETRDALARLVADVACAAYWPVPLVWIAARRLARECELAADERAVRSGIPRATVAEHLVEVARETLAPAPEATFGMASELERRVTVLLDGRPSIWSRRRAVVAVGASFAALAVVACATPGTKGSTVVATSASPSSGGPASTPAADDLAAFAEEERARAVNELGAKGGVVLVMDAKTRAIVAAAGDVDSPRVPGSTVKPLLVAAALDAKVVDPKSTIDCGNGSRMYGARKLSDASPHGALDLATMLAVSSNVGASRVADLLGKERTVAAFSAVGFGAGLPARIEDDYALAVVAAGEGLRATPRALVTAYGALVDGTLDGRAVYRAETAATVRTLLEEVVYGREGTGGRAAIPTARVSGKTGTAEDGAAIYSSFVGFLPSAAPRYVVYVGIDSPRDGAPGGRAAAPVFARIATRLANR